MKVASVRNDVIELRFDESDKCFEFVQNLYGRSYNTNLQCWEIPYTNEVITTLKNRDFKIENLNFKSDVFVRLDVFYNNIKIETDIISLNVLKRHFTDKDLSECFTKNYFDRRKIKYVQFIEDTFLPIGLLSDLRMFLDANSVVYKIIDHRPVLEYEFDDEQIAENLRYLRLYDYQVEAVKCLLTNYNGIVKATTSSGKTELFASLCNLTPMETLILFNRIDLAIQTFERFQQAGLDVGIVQGANLDEDHENVMCTVQSANNLTKRYERIIVDECHLAFSDTYQRLLDNKGLQYRYGFSATPFTKSRKDSSYVNTRVKQWLGDVIFTVGADKLIADGRIAEPHIKIIRMESKILLDFLRDNPDNDEIVEDWREMEKLAIINNVERNNKIKDICTAEFAKILILVKSIEHGEILESLIPDSLFISGITKVRDRKKAMKEFELQDSFILIASTIFDEGISLKTIEVLIIAGGGNSDKKTIQRLGRGLRITESKKDVLVYDFMDIGSRILERHSKNRIKYYNQEGFTDIEFI